MSLSTELECNICGRLLNEKDDTVTTDCQHTFHRQCAQKRLDEDERSDCRKCKRKSALSDALARFKTIKKLACIICDQSLDVNDDLVTTECQHTFHRQCAQKRLDENERSDCRKCKKTSALGDALQRSNPVLEGYCGICDKELGRKSSTIITPCQHIFHRHCIQERYEKKKESDCLECDQKFDIGTLLPGYQETSTIITSIPQKSQNVKPIENVTSESMMSTVTTMDIDEQYWRCANCSVKNEPSSELCGGCQKPPRNSLMNSAILTKNFDACHPSTVLSKNLQIYDF
ncbi:unnamed protein product [Rotaria socialis]|uniref:RanBP-type and C3HC4-type zinc finger-containing protein 1 n=1 Tax=Rotaria socialis TaxID=392032 RepID=A0A818BCA9_9BILA|nr:unnamed protein product [Rotaria socialis]